MPKSDNGHSRLDRIEAILAAGAARQADREREFARLFRTQVALAGLMRELSRIVRRVPPTQ